MRTRGFKVVVLAAMAGYLLAAVGAAGLHEAEHRRQHANTAASEQKSSHKHHHHHHHGHRHSHSHGEADQQHSHHPLHDEHDCQTCELLAQPLLAPSIIAVTESIVSVQPAPPAIIATPELPTLLVLHVRGPPLSA